jgi:RNA polymerase-binding transcription factor DksA
VDLHSYLLSRQGELVQDAREEKPAFSLHMADAGTDNYDQDFALSMISSEQAALYEIEAAINRIKDGTYGICELTGKPIEPARLTAIPWTRFSTQAEQQLEREGEIQRTRLGPRETVPRTEPAQEAEEEG